MTSHSMSYVCGLVAILVLNTNFLSAQYIVTMKDGKIVDGDVKEYSGSVLVLKVYSKTLDKYNDLTLQKDIIRSVYDVLNDRDVTLTYLAVSTLPSTQTGVDQDLYERQLKTQQQQPVSIPGNTYGKNLIDVVYLNDGSVIKGVIIEQIPNQLLRIQTRDGSIFTYEYTKITRLGKDVDPFEQEEVSEKSPLLAFVLSFMITGVGQFYNEQVGKGVLMMGGAIAGFAMMASNPRDPEPGLIVWLGCTLWSLIDAPVSASAINNDAKKRRYGYLYEKEVGPGTLGFDITSIDRQIGVKFAYHF
ncbi:MAG: hypothetical protein M5R41_19320 [Bacteroidia bacterium]|nr:hypothetical protein [Bacteroidia bacterium]